MFDKNFKNNQIFLFLFFLSVYCFYILLPYFFNLTNYFTIILLDHFPIYSHNKDRNYILETYNLINFNYIFILNTVLFLILILLFYLINTNRNISKNSVDNYFLYLSEIVVIVCLFYLVLDLFEYWTHYKNVLIKSNLSFLDRNGFYEFFNGRKQTHYIVGAIFSLFLLKNSRLITPLIFIFILCCLEIFSLSRFYIFLIFSALLIISNKKLIPIFIFFLFSIVIYRLYIFSFTAEGFLSNLFFEPVSLISNEIIKLLNGAVEFKNSNFFSDLILKNIFSNFLFFEYSSTYYIFEDKHYPHYRSFAQFGLLDILAYPLQTLMLAICILCLKFFLSRFYNFRDLYIISSVFILFMIIRGSAIYGLSFLFKVQLILVILVISSNIIKRLKFFKSSP
tara:strand:+ start:4875 stop:6056 length:1182 start_codon:yes stop_codon:yes gene_type:complete